MRKVDVAPSLVERARAAASAYRLPEHRAIQLYLLFGHDETAIETAVNQALDVIFGEVPEYRFNRSLDRKPLVLKD